MQCKCDDWLKNVNLINSSITLAMIHGANYDIKVFKFCPWCGNKLEETK